MIHPQDLQPGKNYFCRYETKIDAKQIPAIADIPGNIPTSVIGVGQLLKRDLDSELLELIDLETYQRYTVKFTEVSEITPVDK